MIRIFLFMILFSVNLWAENPKEITIGFLPSGKVESTKIGGLKLAKALQQEIGIPVNVLISKNYNDLIDALKNKKADFAFLSAMSYVVAEQKTGVKVLLKKVWNEPFYYSLLVTTKKSGIAKISDIKGKRLAFVDEKSTSGYLASQILFKNKNWDTKDFKSTVFTGSHSKSVEALESGAVDVAAIFSDDKDGKLSAFAKYAKQPSQQKVLWVSEPLPNDPLCVRQDFYDTHPKLVHSLMFALIDVADKLKSDPEMKDILGANGFMPATSRQYDGVRTLVKELNPKIE